VVFAGDDSEKVEGEEAEQSEDGEHREDESDTSQAKGATESLFGVSGAERAWSRKLGTDPYSTNEVLRAVIKEVAWAERLGQFGMRFAGIPAIPGADETLIEEYLENPRMSPSQQTLLTAAISEIEGAAGRDGILRQALNVETEAEANFLIKSVTMLAWYHLNQKPAFTPGWLRGRILPACRRARSTRRPGQRLHFHATSLEARQEASPGLIAFRSTHHSDASGHTPWQSLTMMQWCSVRACAAARSRLSTV
jgi:hypothetical protein